MKPDGIWGILTGKTTVKKYEPQAVIHHKSNTYYFLQANDVNLNAQSIPEWNHGRYNLNQLPQFLEEQGQGFMSEEMSVETERVSIRRNFWESFAWGMSGSARFRQGTSLYQAGRPRMKQQIVESHSAAANISSNTPSAPPTPILPRKTVKKEYIELYSELRAKHGGNVTVQRNGTDLFRIHDPINSDHGTKVTEFQRKPIQRGFSTPNDRQVRKPDIRKIKKAINKEGGYTLRKKNGKTV